MSRNNINSKVMGTKWTENTDAFRDTEERAIRSSVHVIGDPAGDQEPREAIFKKIMSVFSKLTYKNLSSS